MRNLIITSILMALLLFGCTDTKTPVKITEKQENKTMPEVLEQQTDKVQVMEDLNKTVEITKEETKNLTKEKQNQTNQTIDNNTTKEIKNRIEQEDCVDNDNGDIFTLGVVRDRGRTFVDVCTGFQNVKEYVCVKNNVENYITQCPFDYECLNGRCSLIKQTCTDTDGGINENVSGYLKIQNASGVITTIKDKCIDIYNVQEYYCNGIEPAYITVSCKGNVTCNIDQGACNFK